MSIWVNLSISGAKFQVFWSFASLIRRLMSLTLILFVPQNYAEPRMTQKPSVDWKKNWRRPMIQIHFINYLLIHDDRFPKMGVFPKDHPYFNKTFYEINHPAEKRGSPWLWNPHIPSWHSTVWSGRKTSAAGTGGTLEENRGKWPGSPQRSDPGSALPTVYFAYLSGGFRVLFKFLVKNSWLRSEMFRSHLFSPSNWIRGSLIYGYESNRWMSYEHHQSHSICHWNILKYHWHILVDGFKLVFMFHFIYGMSSETHWRTPWFFRGVGQPPSRITISNNHPINLLFIDNQRFHNMSVTSNYHPFIDGDFPWNQPSSDKGIYAPWDVHGMPRGRDGSIEKGHRCREEEGRAAVLWKASNPLVGMQYHILVTRGWMKTLAIRSDCDSRFLGFRVLI